MAGRSLWSISGGFWPTSSPAWPASTTLRTAAGPRKRKMPVFSNSCGLKRRHIMDLDQPFAHVPIDAVRSFWDARPCNIQHSPKAIGTREYFDEVEQRKYFVEPHIPGFADFSRWNGKK